MDPFRDQAFYTSMIGHGAGGMAEKGQQQSIARDR